MKTLILSSLFLFFGTFTFAQQSNFRFANFTAKDVEKVETRPEFDFNAEELKDLPTTELLSLFVEEYLNVQNVKGSGKMTTLLSLEISDKGILENVSAIGANESFNKEAVAVFKKFEGREMNINSLKNINTEVLIPITVIL